MIEGNYGHLNQADGDITSPLNLDATPLEQFRYLTSWHLEFAKENPHTFRELMTLLSSLGVKYETLQVNSRIFNFAQQSFSSAQKLRFLDQLERLAYLPQFSPCGGKVSVYESRPKKPSLDDQWHTAETRQKESLRQHGKLDDLFRHSITQIKNERNQEILCRRLGLSPYEVHTLQEAGDAVGITRERVRQLVKKEMTKLEKACLWDDVFREEINCLFQKFGPLLPLDNLAFLSDWFEGFDLTVKSWEAFVEYFAPDVSIVKNGSFAWLAPIDSVSSLIKISEKFGDLRAEGASADELDEIFGDTAELKIPNVDYFKAQFPNLVPEGKVTDAALVRKFLRVTSTIFDLDDFYHFCMRNDHVVDRGNSRSILARFSLFAAPISRSPTKYISLSGLELINPNIDEYVENFLSFWS